jgi:hypothetical protein
MGLGLIEDGFPTKDHPEMENYLAKAREAAIGQRVVALEWREVVNGGRAADALQIILENGQVLVLFSPAAYGLGQHKAVEL